MQEPGTQLTQWAKFSHQLNLPGWAAAFGRAGAAGHGPPMISAGRDRDNYSDSDGRRPQAASLRLELRLPPGHRDRPPATQPGSKAGMMDDGFHWFRPGPAGILIKRDYDVSSCAGADPGCR